MKTYLRNIMSFISDEEGASASEYALLVMVIAVVILAGVMAYGTSLSGPFTRNADEVGSALPQ